MAIALLFFSGVLLLAILLSGLAHRSVLSTAALFLAAGFVAGPEVLGIFQLPPQGTFVAGAAQIALFVVLFSDALRIDIGDLIRRWQLPTRALLIGLPLTFLFTVVAGLAVGALPFAMALLVAAVLTPTDPVFASAIVGREEVSHRVRHLLNVESGINDGLALPLVIAALHFAEGRPTHLGVLGLELLAGVALGVVLPLGAVWLEKRRFFGASVKYQPLFVFGVGLLLYFVCAVTPANPFLAAFAAGVTIASTSRELLESYLPFGEPLAELAKLGAIFVFGALISPSMLAELAWYEWAFIGVVLLGTRPLALAVALWRSPLSRRERMAVGWFGPRGFASVVYGLYVFQSALPNHVHVAHLIAVVVAASILAHSSTDVLIARRLEDVGPSDQRFSTTRSRVCSRSICPAKRLNR